MKLKNPYSHKRLSLKDKLNRKFTDFVVPHIKKIHIDEDWNAKSKYIPKVLESARGNIEGWEREKISTAEIPKEIDLDFLSIYLAEYIPIENVDQLNKGLKKLVKKYPLRFQYEQAERIDEFCNGVKKSIQGGRWSNFGFIDFTKEKKVSDFVKDIEIHGTHLSSSSIILQLVIKPSDKFINEYKRIIERDVKEGYSFDLSLKSFFKFWGGKNLSDDIVKNQMIEDLIIELKWRVMKEINNYIPLYFTENKLLPPSIEVYKLNQTTCTFKTNENEKLSSFWNSIGMSNSFNDISKDGYWQLFTEGRKPYLIDNSLKITCNSAIPRKPMYGSLDTQIVHRLSEFSNLLLPIMVMREYTADISQKIAIQQNETFSSIQKANPKYRKLINIRYELERNLQILKRFKNEIDINYFNKMKFRINKIVNFEPSHPRYSDMSATEMIVDSTEYIIDKTYEHSENFAKIIDDTVQLIEIRTNNSLRKRSFGLSVITVIFSVTATTFAGLSLFYQLSDDRQREIFNLFSPFVELWQYFF